MEYSFVGLIIVVLDIFAIMQVLGSNEEGSTKIIWALLILFLPVLGLIAWWFAGPKKA